MFSLSIYSVFTARIVVRGLFIFCPFSKVISSDLGRKKEQHRILIPDSSNCSNIFRSATSTKQDFLTPLDTSAVTRRTRWSTLPDPAQELISHFQSCIFSFLKRARAIAYCYSFSAAVGYVLSANGGAWHALCVENSAFIFLRSTVLH